MSARRATPARPGKQLIAHDRATGHRYVAGADEAGRGCLAGPLVAAAVVLDIDRLVGPDAALLGRLDDSKKLSHELREMLFSRVTSLADSWSVRIMSASFIDSHGIQPANLRALHGALSGLRTRVDIAFCDGFDLSLPQRHLDGVTPLRFSVQQLIKGDRTSAAVAAAAIIAKVTRDRLMNDLDLHTGGSWAYHEHHGYATASHHQRIQAHGITEHHRRCFASTAYDGAMDVRALPEASERIAKMLDADERSVSVLSHDHDVESIPVHAVLQ